MIGSAVLQAISTLEEIMARKAWINSLPEDMAKIIRASDAKRAEEESIHQRNLEVAEAGRARNFWGN